MSASVATVDDAFTRAVAEARDRLSSREGRTVSWREIVRRAGYDDPKMFGRISYHLLPRDRDRGAHLVPAYIIEAMAKVLPISRAELMRAAAEASGYDLEGSEMTPSDVVVLVTRTLQDVDPDERDTIGSEVIEAILRARRRDREERKRDTK